jgi:lipoprotein-anchoring transpeptidase ErfK/SrfK
MRGKDRLDTTGTVAVLVAVTGIIVAVAANHPGPKPAPRPAPATPAPATSAPATSAPATSAPAARGGAPRGAANATPALTTWPGAPASTAKTARTAGPARAATPARGPATSLVLTAVDRQDCPAAATACVDLTRHITWLQGKGAVTFGPVQMEPGPPGGKHQTPRGAFHVQWKAGPGYVSNIYNEPMPWATFFAAGGIAFHGGSLTAWSHGCVHLTDANARYYNEHLPVGAEVVVF